MTYVGSLSGVEVEQNKDILTDAILGPLEAMELGTPLSMANTRSGPAVRNLKLPPGHWLADPLRQRIDAHLDIPVAMQAYRDPPLKPATLWSRLQLWRASR